jgi:hypothetical protein
VRHAPGIPHALGLSGARIHAGLGRDARREGKTVSRRHCKAPPARAKARRDRLAMTAEASEPGAGAPSGPQPIACRFLKNDERRDIQGSPFVPARDARLAGPFRISGRPENNTRNLADPARKGKPFRTTESARSSGSPFADTVCNLLIYRSLFYTGVIHPMSRRGLVPPPLVTAISMNRTSAMSRAES